MAVSCQSAHVLEACPSHARNTLFPCTKHGGGGGGGSGGGRGGGGGGGGGGCTATVSSSVSAVSCLAATVSEASAHESSQSSTVYSILAAVNISANCPSCHGRRCVIYR